MTEINKVESDRWKNQSKYDFELAKKLIDTEFSHSCFMFQQAAEKAIVSYDFLKSYGPILDKYLYSTRYPTFSLSGSPYEIFTKEDSNKAKELSGDVIKFCDEKVKDQGWLIKLFY